MQRYRNRDPLINQLLKLFRIRFKLMDIDDLKNRARNIFENYNHASHHLTPEDIDWLLDFKLQIEDLEGTSEQLEAIAHNYLIYGPVLRWLIKKQNDHE